MEDAAVIAGHLEYLRLEGRSETTRRARGQVLGALAAALPCPLLDAGRPELLRWRAGLAVGPASICAYVSHVRQFYFWAADEGLIGIDPARRLPVPRRGRGVPRPIATEDLMRALENPPGRIRLWLVLAAWAGLRCKEIALLRPECILLYRRPEPALLVSRDAAKGGHERLVPLAPFAVAEIAAAGLPARGWSFRRCDGQRGPNTPHRVSELIGDYLHECGIDATAHRLRHWFGTSVLDASGRDLRLTQGLLGHESITTTQIYTDWDLAAAAAAVAKLPVPAPRLRVVGDAS